MTTRKLTIAVLSVALLSGLVNAQSIKFDWANSRGGFSSEYAFSIALDADRNIYTTGIFRVTVDFDPGTGTFNLSSLGDTDAYISKLDSLGNFEWAIQFGSSSWDGGNGITVDDSGYVYSTGQFNGTVDFDPGIDTFNLTSVGSYDIYVVKIDPLGNLVWAKSMGGTSQDIGNAIAVDSSGNVYTTGEFNGTVDFDPGPGSFDIITFGGKDAFISKLNSSGDFVWAKQLGGTSSDEGISLALDALENVYTTGNFSVTSDFNPSSSTHNMSAVGSYDVYISKLSSSGNFIWAKQMGGADIDWGYSIELDVQDNLYVMGQFWGTADFDPSSGVFNLTSLGVEDVFLTKLTSSGNLIWAKQIGSASRLWACNMAVDNSGNVYTMGGFEDTVDFDPGTGVYNLNTGGYDAFVTKLDPSGGFVWAKQTAGYLCCGLNPGDGDIAIDTWGNIYQTGYFAGNVDFDPGFGTYMLSSNGGTDAYVRKMSPCTPSYSTIAVSACINYDWQGNTYLASGIYEDIVTSASGCDSIMTLELTIITCTGHVLAEQKISDWQGQFYGTLSNEDRMGISVTSIGDLDGDGITDLAVGAYLDDDGGSNRGAVWIMFLDIDGTVKSFQKISDTQGNFSGTLNNVDVFGNSVASIGDLDGDGVTDLAVGAMYDEDGGTDHGAVWVLFLNTDGTVKSHQKISDTQGNFTGILNSQEIFGVSVSALGDLDGDGIMDLAVGASGSDDGGTNRGAVWILFLNTNGTVKAQQKISDTQGSFTGVLSDFDYFGFSVAPIGDLNGDSIIDIAVGAYFDDDGGADRGAVWILFLNTDGTVLADQKISDTQGGFTGVLGNADNFGTSIASMGDVNGDGTMDLAVGTFLDDDGGLNRGAVWMLFLNVNGTVQSSQKISNTEGNFTGILDNSDYFGVSATSIGDLNGDGKTDLAVGAFYDDDGSTDRGAIWILFLDGVPPCTSTITLADTTLCPGDSIYLEGAWQSTAGTYYDTLSTSLGCDSVVEIVLTLNSTSNNATPDLSICEGESVQIFGTFQMTAGTYYDSLTAVNGCDSIISTTLTVDSLPEVYFNGLDSNYCSMDVAVNLTGSPAGGTFSGPGMSGIIFDPFTAGTGTHIITYTFTGIDSCTNSESKNVFVNACTGIDLEAFINSLVVYPNPTTGEFEVEFTVVEPMDLELNITNGVGQIVIREKLTLFKGRHSEPIDLRMYPAGIYNLELITDERVINSQVIIK